MESSQIINQPTEARLSFDKIPSRFLCPLSQQIFFEPVVAQDGRTYEREMIEQYFAVCQTQQKPITSPMTRAPIATTLITNWDKVGEIHELLTEHPYLWEEVYKSKKFREDLNACVKNQDVQQLMKFIELDPRIIDEKDASGETLFDKVCHSGSFDLLKLIVPKLNDKLKGMVKNDLQLLETIAERFGASGVTLLAPSFCWDLNAYKAQAITAVKKGNLMALKTWLSLDVPVELCEEGTPLLHLAVEAGHVDVMNYLISQKLDINSTNIYQETALHLAASKGQKAITERLLTLGANAKALNHQNLTAAQVARAQGHVELAAFIEQKPREIKFAPLLNPLQSKQQEFISSINLLNQKVTQQEKDIETLKDKLFTQEQKYTSLLSILHEKLALQETKLTEQAQYIESQNKMLQSFKFSDANKNTIDDKQKFQLLDIQAKTLVTQQEEIAAKIASQQNLFKVLAKNMQFFTQMMPIENTNNYYKEGEICHAISSKGYAASSTSKYNSLIVWDIYTNTPVKTFAGYPSKIRCVAMLSQDRIACASGGIVTIWNINTGQCLIKLEAQSKVTNLSVLPNNDLVGVSQNIISVWDSNTGSIIATLKGHLYTIRALTVLPNGNFISLANGFSNEIYLWNVKTRQSQKIFLNDELGKSFSPSSGATMGGHITCLGTLSDNLIIGGSNRGIVYVWDINTGQCLHKLLEHNQEIICVVAMPDGRIASAARDKTIKIWDTKSGAVITLNSGDSGVASLYVLPNNCLISTSFNGHIKMWSNQISQKLESVKAEIIQQVPECKIM